MQEAQLLTEADRDRVRASRQALRPNAQGLGPAVLLSSASGHSPDPLQPTDRTEGENHLVQGVRAGSQALCGPAVFDQPWDRKK